MMQKAFVLINCDVGSEKRVIDQLRKLDDVKDVHGTFGIYDIIATIESDKQTTLKKIISDQIRKINHITSILTLLDTISDEEKPDLIPDVIPEEKKPVEPPGNDEFGEEDFDDDFEEEEEGFLQKKKQRYKSVYRKRYRE